ncbi:hypothetical protein ESCO_001005 [Escovopsis weberi]|uniref:Cytochrome b561 domain-containing protein n=1 Tax=Escovopsis weberi TaxID=150374 RepID=A0A0M9VTW7_ESCWE|nr:hypothetical protein ESCO_001005 [Escovopsis weberi]
MGSPTWRALALLAILNAAALTPVLADPASYCPHAANGLCFDWAIPQSSQDDDQGPIFLRIQAPTSYEWVALGMGPDMPDSSIFVIYQDGAGNVTLSTRPGADHVMPLYTPVSDVELLAGSGVSSGSGSGEQQTLMTANIRCGAWCARLALAGSNPWIAAWRSGGPMDSPDPAAPLAQHDNHDQFAVDFSIAGVVPASGNPFMAGDFSGSSAGGSSGSGDGAAASAVTNLGVSLAALRSAHGLIMAIVFLVLYPVGAMLMPLLGRWHAHAAWQLVAFLAMWAAFGIGYTVAHRQNIFFDTVHTRLGIFTVCLISIQPLTGAIHHRLFRKTSARSTWSHIHTWAGRALVLLGVVNGGLGIADRAADITDRTRHSYIVAFSVVAALMGALYIGVAVAVPWSRRGGGWPVKSKRSASPPEAAHSD